MSVQSWLVVIVRAPLVKSAFLSCCGQCPQISLFVDIARRCRNGIERIRPDSLRPVFTESSENNSYGDNNPTPTIGRKRL